MTQYAELHAHSGFSFLDGASDPEELAAEAVRLGLGALALTDHHGLYGVVRFAEAARAVGLATVFGAEITLGGDDDRTGVTDPSGEHLVVLARSPEGYRRLATTLGEAHLARGGKGAPRLTLYELAGAAREWLVLTGCRKGPLTRALVGEGPRAARRELGRLVGAFGRENLAVELWDHGTFDDAARNDALAEVAITLGVDVVATGNVHYAAPDAFARANVLAAIRARRSLEEMEGWLDTSPLAHPRSDAEPRRSGPRGAERVSGAWRQIDHELGVIGALGFAGYFLTVWDITEFCRAKDIYCQGRGSAANSAVCYSLGITNADAVALHLFFE